MGEANRRGTRDERVAAAVAKQQERERKWNEAQAERRKQRLEDEAKAAAIRPRESPKRANNRLMLAAVMAIAGIGAIHK
jgi:hypothetical protein